MEQLTDGAGDQRLLGLADVAAQVAGEVHGAALPGAAKDLIDGGLQPGVGVKDAGANAVQPAGA